MYEQTFKSGNELIIFDQTDKTRKGGDMYQRGIGFIISKPLYPRYNISAVKQISEKVFFFSFFLLFFFSLIMV